jgi:hypothetical protein
MNTIPPGRRRPSALALILFGITAVAPWISGGAAALRFPALCVVPGAAVLLLAAPRIWRRPARAMAAALLGSAALAPAVLFAGMRLLGSMDRALVAACLLWAFVVAAGYLSRSGAFSGVIGSLRAYVRGWTAMTGIALLLALPLLLNPELRVARVRTHIALVRDPHRAWPGRIRGSRQPLRYFWFTILGKGFSARRALLPALTLQLRDDAPTSRRCSRQSPSSIAAPGPRAQTVVAA